MAYASVGLKTHIWNNNLKSMLLLAGFPFLIFLMAWAIVGSYFGLQLAEQSPSPDYWLAAEQGLFATAYHLHWLLLGVGIWFIIAWLSHQAMINRATGAKSVTRKEQPHLYNLLENLCVSRGLPMPKLCLIDSPTLNAYASGVSDKSYTITVTTGLMETLDDKEMEAVLAHELTHIINKDVRLLIISIIFVGIISFVAEMIFRSIFRVRYIGRRRNSKSGGLLILIALLVVAVGYVFAILIRFALSRKREYLADAGAVELTKNPQALVSALQKISGNARMEDAPAEVRQMFIENPPKFGFMNTGLFSMFATHPPMEKRIEVLQGMV